MKTHRKTFDCVEMMHRGALRIHEELKGKTKEEQLAYWRQRHRELLEEQVRLRPRSLTRPR